MSINSGGQMRRRGGEVVAEKEVVAEEGKEIVADFKPSDYSCEILLEKTTEDKARDKKFPSDACIIRYTVDGKQLIDVTRSASKLIFLTSTMISMVKGHYRRLSGGMGQ